MRMRAMMRRAQAWSSLSPRLNARSAQRVIKNLLPQVRYRLSRIRATRSSEASNRSLFLYRTHTPLNHRRLVKRSWKLQSSLKKSLRVLSRPRATLKGLARRLELQGAAAPAQALRNRPPILRPYLLGRHYLRNLRVRVVKNKSWGLLLCRIDQHQKTSAQSRR